MKTHEELKETPHLCLTTPANLQGLLVWTGWVKWPDFEGTVVIGFDEDGWEHVSVSHHNKKRLPSWDVMCRLKDMFWYPEETVVQMHPKESQYVHGVGDRGNVLHLWRPKDGDWSKLSEM